jgi:hypothetical protein
VALLAVGAFAYTQGNKKSEHLQERFGPEYDRAVGEAGTRSEAEKQLAAREQRVDSFKMRDLSPEERSQFADQWKKVQANFVEAPETAILAADELVQKVMLARGYPMADFDQRADDLSVNHGAMVNNYRSAHTISESHRQSPRSTEELRQAMVHYRALFEDLLGAVRTRS